MLTLPEKLLFALIVVGSTSYFVLRTVTLFRLIRLGQPDPDRRTDNLASNIVGTVLDVLLQRRVLRKPIVGFFHMLIVWGFIVFAVNTINHFAGAFITDFHLFGGTALALYYTSIADLFALLIITGVLGMAIRRHVFRPPNLTRPSFESALVFSCIGGAMVAYLWSNACEIAVHPGPHDNYHFASAYLAKGMAGMAETNMIVMVHVAWWADALMHLLLVALLVIPTKHMHLVAAPVNLSLPRKRPRGTLAFMDFEDENAESFGVSKSEEFTWKQNLDLYACIECGRCQDFCPTRNSGKPLKPKHLIIDLKHHLLTQGPALLKQAAATEGEGGKAQSEENAEAAPALIGGVIDKDAIWACTTCAACVEHCPMGIEHIDKLIDMRRHLVLMEAEFPEEADLAFRNMENAGNPWALGREARTAWAKGLDVPTFAEKKEADVLFWVGCSGSYDDRNQKVTVAMVKILKAAGIDFAILGEEERCTCEAARRLGNEYLYQTATQEIIEVLGQYKFKRILVTCPHCFNTFENDHPQLGVEHSIVHHTQLVAELMRDGKLPVQKGAANGHSVVYHDSCYLGRHNSIFDEPRNTLEAAGCSLAHVPREREKGFCCGGGGGRMWLEETIGESISQVRVKELLGAKTDEIAAACPFCITMLTDALKSQDREDVGVKDVAEIVADAL